MNKSNVMYAAQCLKNMNVTLKGIDLGAQDPVLYECTFTK
jgi:hypothetical protein